MAAPLIGSSVALIVGVRVGASLITGGVGYIISNLIKSEKWIEQTKIINYPAPEGHKIYADPTF